MAHSDEDLDLAIALSLQEQEAAAKPRSGGSAAPLFDPQELALFTDQPLSATRPAAAAASNVDEDFALALKLQEELNDATDKPTVPEPSSTRRPSAARPAANACLRCGEPIGWLSRITLTNGDSYHARCLVCEVCGEPLRGSFTQYNGKMAHQECSVALLPTCVVCRRAMTDAWLRHEFFKDHTFCVEHQGGPMCFACRRFGAPGADLARLSDGRSICEVCSTDMIMDSEEAALVYPQVLEFMERVLRLRIPPEMRVVPILAVDMPTLNEQPRGGGHHGHNATTRGLCLSEQTMVHHFGRNGMRLQTQLAQSTVTAILVLHQLPRELFSSILAHEAMHAWLKLSPRFARRLPPQMEEGLCQWVADQFLQHLQDQRRGRQDLVRYFRHCIQTDQTEVYGEGFRKCAAAIGTVGLDIFLEHIEQSDEFPAV